MHIKSLTFDEPFRNFKKDTTLNFPNRVTVIVGDNGAGKSSLIGSLRSKFETNWTNSQIHNPFRPIPVSVSPEPEQDTPMTYIDLASDLMKTAGHMDDNNMDQHLRTLHKSSGQSSLLQLSTLMEKSKANIHIIDEPERGLSLAKTIILASLIKETTLERKDDQFFIVTHSQILMDTLEEDVLFLPNGIYMKPNDYYAESFVHGHEQAKHYITARRAEQDE